MLAYINIFFRSLCLCSVLFIINSNCFSFENASVPQQWASLEQILKSRINQKQPKMKLSSEQAQNLISFLQQHKSNDFPSLQSLQKQLPKTTLELLIAMQSRSLDKQEAEKMAHYLEHLLEEFQFKNVLAFDENTSHIIGREWAQIDYSGEGMTWQAQKAKYQPYGITDFKSLACLKKFFPVESRLPYFNKTYQPQKQPVLE
jgi:hypothetical protein